jgi:hypothetical protein
MEQIHRQYQTNVFGLTALKTSFIPHMRAQSVRRDREPLLDQR